MTSLGFVLVLTVVWGYAVIVTMVTLRFARRPPDAPDGAPIDAPPVSILKPLHGAESGLYGNLLSFADQDYPAHQLVLGVRERADSALPVARAMIHHRPRCASELVIDRRANGSNLKVANLENMLPACRHNLLAIADADMRVGRDYLANVVAPLADQRIGLVTCLYTGTAGSGRWSQLAAMHVNYGFLPSALVGDAIGVGGGCFGATVALRRDVLERVGGLARLRNELADDHRLGSAVRALGLKVMLSRTLVENRVDEASLASLWRHELRWARTSRAMAPLGFAGSVITHTVPVTALAAGAFGVGAAAASGFVLAALLLRWVSARDRKSVV